MFVFQQKFRRAHIGCQHALFNQLVCIVAHHRHDALDFAAIVKQHLCFGAFKFHGTALLTFFLQNLKQFI